MKHYLAPVLRAQFTLFYRFGKTYLPKANLISFDGNWDETINIALVDKFKVLPPFQYDEEYIILHLEKESESNSDVFEFDITDVSAIYPLSVQARQSISMKIDERIRLEAPISSHVLTKIEQRIEQEEMYKAFDALWTIFEVKTPLDAVLKSINIHEILEGLDLRRKGIKAKNATGKSYYSYLMAYERYGYFPKSKLGYFYDAGEVFAYFKGKPTFEGSRIHSLLEELQREGSGISFGKVVKGLQDSPIAKDYIGQTSQGSLRNFILAPMFFMFKEEFKEVEDITKTVAYQTREKLKDFQKEFEVVLVLLGAFFGYQRFYDAYYDKASLRFYKNSIKPIKKQPINNEPAEVEEPTPTPSAASPELPIIQEEQPVEVSPSKPSQNEGKQDEEPKKQGELQEPSDVNLVSVKGKSEEPLQEVPSGPIQEKKDDDIDFEALGLEKQVFKILAKKPECTLSVIKSELKKVHKREFNDEQINKVFENMGDKVVKTKSKKAERFALKNDEGEQSVVQQDKKAEQIQLEMD